MKKTITLLALMLPTLVFAQWRIGANVGLSYNHPIIDKQYMTDLEYCLSLYPADGYDDQGEADS